MICAGSLIKGISGTLCFDMKVYILKIHDVRLEFLTLFDNYYRT